MTYLTGRQNAAQIDAMTREFAEIDAAVAADAEERRIRAQNEAAVARHIREWLDRRDAEKSCR